MNGTFQFKVCAVFKIAGILGIVLCFFDEVYAQEEGSGEAVSNAVVDPVVEPGELSTTVIDASPASVSQSGPRAKPRLSQPTTPATPRPTIVNEVVISPTRTPKLLEDVPAAIGVIDENEIARIAPLSFDDLTRSEPNVDFSGGPRYLGEQLIVRGESGSAVTVRIDDARQNFVSGHSGQRFFVETDFLKEVEILKGGGSFLYGSGGAGVISMSTLEPADLIDDGGNVGFRLRNTYQSNTDEWGHSFIGATGNDTIAVLAGVSRRQGGNITLADGVEMPFSGMERESAMGKLVFTPDDETRFAFGINDYSSFDEGGANPQALTVGTTTNAEVGRLVGFTQLTGEYAWNPSVNDLIDLKASVYHNTTNQVRNYSASEGSNVGRSNVHALDVFGFDINNRSVISFNGGREHELVYGIDFYQENQDGSETRDTFFIPGAAGNASGRPDAEASHIGLFLTDEFDVTDSLTIFAGIRYDTYSSEKTIGSNSEQQNSAVLPQIGFDLDVTEKLSFFGQFSKGFTAPTLDDLYQDGSHFGVVPNTPFVETVRDPQGGFFFPAFTAPPPGLINFNYFNEVFIPNPDLLPEESNNFELGLHYEDEDLAGGKFSSRLNGFFKKGKNTFDTQIVGNRFTSPYDGGFATPADVPATVVNPPGAVVFTGIDFEGTLTEAFRQSVNRAETEIYGFEFSADYDADFWFTGLDVGVLRGKDSSTGQKLNTNTGDQVALTLGVRPAENVEVGVRGLWNSGREDLVDDPTLKTSAYDIYGLFGSWKVNELWTIRAGVDNVFDQAHERTSLLLGEPGRNAFISSSIEW
ncbi:MAG: TonB-dependent receptor [Verrucomicrobiales bacterium]|nr:TonB-dependent receptor [Verrucomicrobiales bacterium]